jgi:hypothetical protein
MNADNLKVDHEVQYTFSKATALHILHITSANAASEKERLAQCIRRGVGQTVMILHQHPYIHNSRIDEAGVNASEESSLIFSQSSKMEIPRLIPAYVGDNLLAEAFIRDILEDDGPQCLGDYVVLYFDPEAQNKVHVID